MYNDLIKYPQITAIPSFLLALIGILSVPMFGYGFSCMLLPLFSVMAALLGLVGIRASLAEHTKGFLWLSLLGTIGALVCFRIFFMAWDYQMHLDPIE